MIPIERIASRIFQVRGQKVMIDSDLAELYQVLTKNFNLAGERHKLVFKWMVFNLPNHPNFDDRSVSTDPRSRRTFGKYTSTIGADERNNNGRVMQFSLSYQF